MHQPARLTISSVTALVLLALGLSGCATGPQPEVPAAPAVGPTLPPAFPPDPGRLDGFLARMPDWVKVAVEFRHPAWHTGPTLEILRRRRSAYCIMDGAGLPTLLEETAPFVYVRMHGPDQAHLYRGSYQDDRLSHWAELTARWAGRGLEVFLYFNNDADGYAVQNARTLQQMVDRNPPARPL